MSVSAFSPDPFAWAETTYPFFVPSPSLMADIKIVGLDRTAPVITATVDPVPNAIGWTNAPTTVTWNVTDPESGIASSTGCLGETVGDETAGRTITCGATNNAGLAATSSVTVRLDATAPSIVFAGNSGRYEIDEVVDISCTASDGLSQLATPADCGAIQGPAYTFTDPTNLVRSATDRAGNTATAAPNLSIVVSSDGLCRLTRQLVANSGIATSLCEKLEHGAVQAYRNELHALSGTGLAAAVAELLTALSARL
jgi:hypothetical protein